MLGPRLVRIPREPSRALPADLRRPAARGGDGRFEKMGVAPLAGTIAADMSPGDRPGPSERG
jgi:hypothetical protein